ncbi:MAG: hypothetical protein PVI45_07045 [Desulfobacterales bacterium]
MDGKRSFYLNLIFPFVNFRGSAFTGLRTGHAVPIIGRLMALPGPHQLFYWRAFILPIEPADALVEAGAAV